MENQERSEHLEAFRESFRSGLEEMLEMAEFLFDKPKAPDPYSMGIDSRTMDELDEDEMQIAWELTCQALGLDPENLEPHEIRSYTTHAQPKAKVPGQIRVRVYRSEIGLFLQELTFSNGEKSWVIGPDQNI